MMRVVKHRICDGTYLLDIISHTCVPDVCVCGGEGGGGACACASMFVCVCVCVCECDVLFCFLNICKR